MSALVAIPAGDLKAQEPIRKGKEIETNVDPEFGDFFGEIEKVRSILSRTPL